MPKVLLWRLEDLTRFFRGVNAHGRQDSTESAIFTLIWAEVASAHAAAQISSPIIPNWTESLPTVGVNHFTPNFMSLQLRNRIVFVPGSSIAFKSGLGRGKYCFLSLNFTYFSLDFLRSSLTYCDLLKSPILQIIFEHWKIFWFLSLAFRHICCSLLQSYYSCRNVELMLVP